MDYNNRATFAVCGVGYECAASNGAYKVYADQFAGKMPAPYRGSLVADLVTESAEKAGAPFPTWDELPALLRAVWAMARAAGSCKAGWAEFEALVDGGLSDGMEPTRALDLMYGEFGERTFFRFLGGQGGAEEPDEEKA